jgi:hypothetical protein
MKREKTPLISNSLVNTFPRQPIHTQQYKMRCFLWGSCRIKGKSVCDSPLSLLGKRLGKHVPAAKNTHTTIEELLDASFSVLSVSYQMKVCDQFFQKRSVLFSILHTRTGGLFPRRVKRPGNKADYSPQSSADDKNAGSYT